MALLGSQFYEAIISTHPDNSSNMNNIDIVAVVLFHGERNKGDEVYILENKERMG
jgi:hypothetical protein